MVDQVSTLTDSPAASSTVEDSSPGDEVTLMGTVEGDTHDLSEETITTEGEQITEGEKEETVQAEEEGKKGEEKKEEEGKVPDKYSDDPAWQRILRERNEAREATKEEKVRAEKAEAQVEVFKTVKPAEKETKAEEKPPEFEDITQKTRDELIEEFNENPAKFLSNYGRQIRAEVLEDVTTEQSKNSEKEMGEKIMETFDAYGKENESFGDMWKKGELQGYMKKNPGHNAISAHLVLTLDSRIKAAVAKATKETEARVLKEVKSKKHSTVLGAGPGTQASGEELEAELKDTKPRGGLTTVLAAKLKKSREQ